jgi:ribonuclease VapC
MIIDTSALVAVLVGEEGDNRLIDAIADERGGIPAPVCLEFLRVVSGPRFALRGEAEELLAKLDRHGCVTLAFTREHAGIAITAEPRYGTGNGNGGPLNLLDLMVYAVAKERGEPLLCTGKDFAATDLELHAASRPF